MDIARVLLEAQAIAHSCPRVCLQRRHPAHLFCMGHRLAIEFPEIRIECQLPLHTSEGLS
jgi:hypothetical protein